MNTDKDRLILREMYIARAPLGGGLDEPRERFMSDRGGRDLVLRLYVKSARSISPRQLSLTHAPRRGLSAHGLITNGPVNLLSSLSGLRGLSSLRCLSRPKSCTERLNLNLNLKSA